MTTSTFSPSRGSAATSHRGRLTLATAVAPMAWGTTYLVTTELLPPDHPLFAALMRALPAGVIALLMTRRLPRGRWWFRILVLGAFNIGLFFPLLFFTAERLPGGVAATLGASQPLLVTVLAVVILTERFSWWRMSWGIVGVAGVGLVVLGPTAELDPVGIGAGLAGAASMGTGVVLTKRWGRPEGIGPLQYAGWQLTAGGLILLLPAMLLDGPPSQIDAAGAAGYLWLGGIGGLAAYTLWFKGLWTLPVTATALLGLLSPLVAAGLGALVLGESLDPQQLSGFALAITALGAGQFSPRRRKRQETTS
ncbi:EamA family transporter [Arthrobacter rhombi]|uniref:EamA family transporter n=1 Tax=Micrococcaceae TaxID=1268 RepID=UPI001F52F1B7|nr:EamA family transporter [Glutamicibacter sp. BW78]